MPRKRAYGGLLERMLKRTCDVCKGYKYKSTDSGQRCGIGFFFFATLLLFLGLCRHWSLLMMLWHWFTLPSSLIIVCNNFIEGNAPKNSWSSSNFWPLLQTRINWQSLMVSSGSNSLCWFLNGDCDYQATTADLCELNCWYPDNEDWDHPPKLFLNRSTSAFAILTSPFHCLWWRVD